MNDTVLFYIIPIHVSSLVGAFDLLSFFVLPDQVAVVFCFSTSLIVARFHYSVLAGVIIHHSFNLFLAFCWLHLCGADL